MRLSQAQTISTTLSHVINSITFTITTLWNCSIEALTHLKCGFELLLHNQYSFPSQSQSQHQQHCLLTTRHSAPGSVERCAVCLADVADGDEVGALRCCHVFHADCLRLWVRSSKLMTCPLCRASLPAAPSRFGETHEGFGGEMLFFKFCSFDDRLDDNDSWWLR